MGQLAGIDLFGFWLAIFLTFCVLSFLYKDNPFYKLAEHLFIGVSIGYVVTKQYFDTFEPKVVDNLREGRWIYVIGLLLAMMLLLKLSKRLAWVGRYPIAIVVGFYAGIQITGVTQGDLAPQAKRAMQSVVVPQVDLNAAPPSVLNGLPGMSPSVSSKIVAKRDKAPFENLDQLGELEGLTPMQKEDLAAARGNISGLDARVSTGKPGTWWFGTLSEILMLLGMISALIYFYFSAEQKGVVGRVSRIGVWVLMIGFGASFGYTVQGRIALAIGRTLDISGATKDPRLAAQIHGPLVAAISIAVIIVGVVIWEKRRSRGDAE